MGLRPEVLLLRVLQAADPLLPKKELQRQRFWNTEFPAMFSLCVCVDLLSRGFAFSV